MNNPSSQLLVSIIINNYNYEKFLQRAIDSALNQTYSPIEVIVVDDGSTDSSREIIASYGDRIVPVLKPNGGQASTFNAGFKACHGEIICLLDSDDEFHPNKVTECVKFLMQKMQNNPLVLVYHLLEVVDQDGKFLDRYEPASAWDYTPNLYEAARKYRHFPYPAAPTSGDVFSRQLLERILPIPERTENYANSIADNFVVRAAALIGEVYGMEQVLAKYRSHGGNIWQGKKWNLEKFRDLVILRDEFLNKKLEEMNKQPVISFLDSMDSKYYYQQLGNYAEILKLAFRVIKWRVSKESITFLLKVCIQYCLWLINPKLVQLKEN